MDSLLAALLFAAACLGHLVLVVRSHNWFYGSALHRHTVDVLQVLHGLLVLAGPPVFWSAAGLDLRSLFGAGVSFGTHLLAGYVVLCWLAAFVALPWVTVVRLRRCAALESNHTRTVDVAAELGHKPAGDGKYRRLALLPGNQVFQVDFNVRTLLLPRLPAGWDGLTVLHLSDLHLCGTPDRCFYEFVLDRCRDEAPDLVALTGDYVDSVEHHAWVAPLLGRLTARVAVLAVLGNHDLWYEPDELRRRLAGAGATVLSNRWQRLEVRGRPLVAVGHEGPWVKPPPDLSGCPAGEFRLCLSHTPDNYAWARAHGVDLMLSGHVHGGQIRLPWFGSVVVPSRWGRRYDCGVFDEPPTILHVSRGLGGKHPLRYNCRPEVTRLVLRCRPPVGQAQPDVFSSSGTA
jgi:predicted MPP superfamily phosphohydrolase